MRGSPLPVGTANLPEEERMRKSPFAVGAVVPLLAFGVSGRHGRGLPRVYRAQVVVSNR